MGSNLRIPAAGARMAKVAKGVWCHGDSGILPASWGIRSLLRPGLPVRTSQWQWCQCDCPARV